MNQKKVQSDTHYRAENISGVYMQGIQGDEKTKYNYEIFHSHSYTKYNKNVLLHFKMLINILE